MITSNSDLMRRSREKLKPYWGLAFMVALVGALLSVLPGVMDDSLGILNWLYSGALTLGINIFFLTIVRNGIPQFSMLFDGFKNYGTSLLAFLIIAILTIVGFILLIIPGIILAIGFSMTYYIIADNPSISAIDAIQKSWEITKGHKAKIFFLGLRFIPWFLLGLLAFVIGIFFVVPWYNTAMAELYEEIK